MPCSCFCSQTASPIMKKMLADLRERIVVGIVGGSDLPKQKEQMGDNVINEVDYSFSENGLVAYKQGELVGKEVCAVVIVVVVVVVVVRMCI